MNLTYNIIVQVEVILVLGLAAWLLYRSANQASNKQRRGKQTSEDAAVHYNFCELYLKHNMLDRALKCAEKALALLTKDSDIELKVKVLGNMGCIYGRKREYDKALDYTNQAEKLWKLKAFADDTMLETLRQNQQYFQDKLESEPVFALIEQSKQACGADDKEKGLAKAEAAVKLARTKFGPNHWVTATALAQHGWTLMAMGQYVDARRDLNLATITGSGWGKRMSSSYLAQIRKCLEVCEERLGF